MAKLTQEARDTISATPDGAATGAAASMTDASATTTTTSPTAAACRYYSKATPPRSAPALDRRREEAPPSRKGRRGFRMRGALPLSYPPSKLSGPRSNAATSARLCGNQDPHVGADSNRHFPPQMAGALPLSYRRDRIWAINPAASGVTPVDQSGSRRHRPAYAQPPTASDR